MFHECNDNRTEVQAGGKDGTRGYTVDRPLLRCVTIEKGLISRIQSRLIFSPPGSVLGVTGLNIRDVMKDPCIFGKYFLALPRYLLCELILIDRK